MNLQNKYNLEDLMYAVNIADLLSEEDLKAIGVEAVKNFEADLLSRSSWEKRTETSLKLALQVAEQKNFPWPNASNVKFPLITIAALQYHARSYPVLVDGDRPVKCRILGEDKEGLESARATRVEEHMSFQILEEDEDWESEMDKVLITQPIIGCAFKKTYRDVIKNINVSENVLARDLVVNYWTKSLESAPRVTHILFMSRNEIYERVARNLWKDVSEGRQQTDSISLGDTLRQAQDKAQGMTAPDSNDSSTPIEMLEQHCFIDLDDDGYAEPYIVYVRKDNKKVARIVSRFTKNDVKRNKEGKILNIVAEQYFTKYPFIPSPDGGFYDLGFGVLLGPLNESINTIINQLVDAGTMANTAGGFLSRGIKLRGGNYTFNPMEWKHVDTTGDDLRKGIVSLPVREPSQVMFTLLNLLINYGERIGGAVDIMTGQNPGQNTPAETTRTMAEQGMKIFNGIFKRTHRSLKQEFRKLYRLNQIFISSDTPYVSDSKDKKGIVLVSDYEGPVTDVMPTADPAVTSDAQRAHQAMAIAQRVSNTPGLYNRYEAEKYFLKAIKVTDIEKILPDPKGPNAQPAPVNPKVQVEQLKIQAKQASDQLNMKMALLKLMSEAELNQAKIKKLEAEAEAIQIGVATEGEKLRLQEINTQIALQRERRDGILSSIQTMNEVYETMLKGQTMGQPSSEGTPES